LPSHQNQAVPAFDTKYKVVVKYQYEHEYVSIIDWLNNHSSGSVDIKISEGRGYEMFVAFENPDDALVFKIRYM
jgi:hypothetical protein